MQELQLREMKQLVHSDTAAKQQKQDSLDLLLLM